MGKKLSIAQKTALLLILLLSAAVVLVILVPSAKERFYSFAATFILRRELTPRYRAEMLVITILVLYTLLCSAFFFGRLKRLFLDDYKVFFSIYITVFFVISNSAIIASKSFIGYANLWDFGDFVPVIERYAGAPLHGTNYPPLAVLLFKLLNLFLPANGIDTAFAKNYLLTLYSLGTALTLLLLFLSSMGGTGRRNVLCCCSLFLTGPMLFAYQRMNLVLLALVGTLAFVTLRSSRGRAARELALISLAVAANLKLFPAVFGALLLKERRWAEAARAALYGAALFVLPLAAAGLHARPPAARTPNGDASATAQASLPSDIHSFARRIENFSRHKSVWTVSVRAQLHRALERRAVPPRTEEAVARAATLAVFALSLFCFFIARRECQAMLMLSLMCLFIPATTVWYYLIFLLVPLLCRFGDENRTMADCAVSLLFIPVLAYYNSIFFGPLFANECWHLNLMWLITAADIIRSRFFGRSARNGKR